MPILIFGKDMSKSPLDNPIIVTGGDGALASYAQGCMLMGHSDADVTDLAVVDKIAALKPRAIIHTAALTDQKKCEADPREAYMVNAIGAYHMALAAKKSEATLCYVSTNAVFKGEKGTPFTTSDSPDPQNTYGASKYAGELLVTGVLPQALIVRSSWIFGGGKVKDKKFVGNIIKQLQQGTRELKAVDDVVGTPTYGKDLMAALLKFIEEGRTGIMHVTNAGTASRYDMATAAARTLGISIPITPVSRTTFGSSIPQNEALSGETMRPWQDALREYLINEWSQ
jgi:dTDP-4-dehydrorhamnose reductase